MLTFVLLRSSNNYFQIYTHFFGVGQGYLIFMGINEEKEVFIHSLNYLNKK